MMYCIKKVISTLTASVLTLSIVIPRNFAKETVYAEETANSSESAMSENGTETICDVVIDKAQAQAQITYVASVDCVALLAFYDDDGLSLITSVQKDLTKTEDQTTVTVSLPKSIPEHFLLKAFLLDPNTIAPLSREFVTSVYTAGIQEILNAKASDFDPALTVNLDDTV